jgi:superfamily II DNA or RNA helicase
MLNDIIWSDTGAYRTGTKWEPFEFYNKALKESKYLDLLLGYFSSAAINVLSLGFAKFLSSGGSVRMVINNILSPQDKEVLTRVEDGYNYQIPFDLTDFVELKSRLDDYDLHFFQCLGWLIQNNRIDIQVIRPLAKRGISHYKCGVFSDGVNQVGFSGSCNFTAFGLFENLERIDTFFSWEGGRSIVWIKTQTEEFEEIFYKKADFIEYLDSTQIKAAIVENFGNKELSELLIAEEQLWELKKKVLKVANNEGTNNDLTVYSATRSDEPRYPPLFESRPYQKEAYAKWQENGYKGMFAMATGTGKTVTALSCILEEYFIHKFYRFFILVPTIDLAIQWEKEVTGKFNFADTILCSSQNSEWEEYVRELGLSLKLGSKINFCVIITYASFRSAKFQGILRNLFTDGLNEITLIADEAHTLGSDGLLKVLPHAIPKRIGLSATPERVYDKEGEAELCRFFATTPSVHTFSYTMKEAINNGVLCKYYYYPKLVELEREELIKYQEISKKLAKFIDPATGKYRDNPIVSNLLIQRKNVIHKAHNKLACLINIVDEIGREEFSKAFIYVPEGYESNYEESDIQNVDEGDAKIIDKYTETLFNRYKFKLRKFTGETRDREDILTQFEDGKLDALLAMKCLDEGVDVPKTEIAIFCSSTGNPRQYIQRRGRVLRSYPQKEFAYIYDMIVKPPMEVTRNNYKQFNIERGILLSELHRLVNFAALSENMIECLRNLEELCINFDIDIYDMINKEMEK